MKTSFSVRQPLDGPSAAAAGGGRRRFLKHGFALAGGAALTAASGLALGQSLPDWVFDNVKAPGSRLTPAPGPTVEPRRVRLDNLHTGESLDALYFDRGAYVPDALAAVNHILRDYRTGDIYPIDPRVIDLLAALSSRLDARSPYGVISGYRSAATNAMLHSESGEVATHSLHLVGQAIDIRAPGIELAWLRDAARELSRGGVGYYPFSDFVHVDVGRVRTWSGT